jgi:hypothetical protein
MPIGAETVVDVDFDPVRVDLIERLVSVGKRQVDRHVQR